jgi:hypothetical protein
LKPEYDEPLSNFAFNIKLRRYIAEELRAGCNRPGAKTGGGGGFFAKLFGKK